MKNIRLFCVLILVLFTGCSKSVVEFVREGGLETKGLVNLALADSGAQITVSEDNQEHPASTLNNGITSSENWNQGEGWQTEYEGRFSRGGYAGYGVEDPYLAEERGLDESIDTGDTSWRGLRTQTRSGRDISAALGWVIIEFPEKKMVNRAVIHTIDSAEYPAEKFGVSDVALQYWNGIVNTWASVERLGKGRGQTTNAIHGNKSGVITFRFEPVEAAKMRAVIRWTNDSKERRRGYYMHTKGTVRLLEIEIYGYEEVEVDEEAIAVAVTQDANQIAEIKVIIDNYVDGYNRRNIDVLMSSVSQDYLKDGETYSDLWQRMESVLAQYERVKLDLTDVQVILTEEGATATSTYSAHYETSANESLEAAGVLVLQFSKATGNWRITRIDSQ